MPRQDDIDDLLRQIAPLCLEVAAYAQGAAAKFADTEWAREHLARTAAVNQVAGTARWRIVGDTIVRRRDELPPDIELSTSDEEQNQGRYYLRASRVAVVFTIRRKPHRADEQPAFLQLQIEGVNELAPIEYEDDIVIYLAVPPVGHESKFELTTRGKATVSHRLIDLIPAADGTDQPVENLDTSRLAEDDPVVSSAFENTDEEDGAEPRG